MRFDEALRLIRSGASLFRKGWHAQHEWVRLTAFLHGFPVRLPFLAFRTVGGDYVPWVATQADLLAGDWAVYDGPVDAFSGSPGAVPAAPDSVKPVKGGKGVKSRK